MKKIIKGFVFLLILCIVLVLVGRNFIIKFAVEKGVPLVTGLPLEMKNLDIGLFDTNIHIQGLKLKNPAGFSDPIMVDIPEIYVDYELLPLLKKEIKLKEIRLHLKEFMVVKNKDGKVNLDSLKAIQKKEETPPKEKKQSKPKEALPATYIGILNLKVGKVILKDYSKGEKPAIQEYNLNLEETIKDIDNLNTLVGIIVFKALVKTPIWKLINFDLQGLQTMVMGTLGTAQQITEGAVDLTVDVLKNTTEGVTDVLNLPFKKKE